MAINTADDQSYTYTADVLAGPLFFGAIGYGLDRWVFHSGHRWIIAGLILGIVMGIYAAYLRYRRSIAAIEASEQARRQASNQADAQTHGDKDPQPYSSSAIARTDSVPAERAGVGTDHGD